MFVLTLHLDTVVASAESDVAVDPDIQVIYIFFKNIKASITALI